MTANKQQVYIIDDDAAVRESMSLLLETVDIPHQCFATADAFLNGDDGTRRGCLVLDMRMPGINGLELQTKLRQKNNLLPIIFITGHGDIPMAVEAMRRGAADFLSKPLRGQDLLDCIQQALNVETGKRNDLLSHQNMLRKLTTLTSREREVFELVAAGHANKVIGFELNISERTVEVHRARLMSKLEATTLAQLVRIKVTVEQGTAHSPKLC